LAKAASQAPGYVILTAAFPNSELSGGMNPVSSKAFLSFEAVIPDVIIEFYCFFNSILCIFKLSGIGRH